VTIYSDLRALAVDIQNSVDRDSLTRDSDITRKVIENVGRIGVLLDDAEKQSQALGLRWVPEEDHFASELRTHLPFFKRIPDADVVTPDGGVAHSLIQGDNLLALVALAATHKGSVKLVLIDPPYVSNSDEMTFRDRFSHSFWLTLMAARLIAAKRLLQKDGIIYVHIDDSELRHLWLLMDAIFGEDAFVANQIWKKKAGGGNDAHGITTDHEYVLTFGASPLVKPTFYLDSVAVAGESYPLQDENGNYTLIRLDKTSLRYAPTLDFPIVGPDGETYLPEIRVPGQKVCWRWSQANVAAYKDDLVFKDGKVYTKNYEKDAQQPRTLLTDERFGRSQTGKGNLKVVLGSDKFSFPKPVELIKHLVRIATAEDDIVLDFFAGSGTTGQAVAELNTEDGGTRQAILVTDAGLASEAGPSAATTDKQRARAVNIAQDITRERLRRVLTGEDWADGKPHPSLGQGLQVFEMGLLPSRKREVVKYNVDGAVYGKGTEPKKDAELYRELRPYLFAAALIAHNAVPVLETAEFSLAVSHDSRAVIVAHDSEALDDDEDVFESLRVAISSLGDVSSAVVVSEDDTAYDWEERLGLICTNDPLAAKLVGEWRAAISNSGA
jgi:adenine-specific DNA-methyltransferase